jgi:excisionase family DNA binding protein
MPPIFTDARDLAERLDVTYDTVLSWVRRGKIPHVRDGRNRLMFNLDSVIEASRQGSRGPQPEARPEGVARG